MNKPTSTLLPTLEISLLNMEPRLRERLNSGEMPFLGLYSELFPQSFRETLRRALHEVNDPFRFFHRRLEKFPAVFTAYLTAYVVDDYGANGDAAVWRFIENALFAGKRSLTQPEQEMLWKRYRYACVRLGLEVIPAGSVVKYRVEEFLHQAGVPNRYLKQLTERMLHHVKVAGIPEADDPKDLALWCESLVERLGPPVPKTVRRAIEVDRSGFYARLFLRVLAGEPADLVSADRSIHAQMEEVIAAAQTDQQHLLQPGLTIPKIIWRDDLLGVELPAGNRHDWQIAVNDQPHQYQGFNEPRFIPFDFPPLPGNVRISSGSDRLTKSVDLWGDGRNNRLLAFDSAGLLSGSTCLNATETLQIEPGTLTLVTRFRPDGTDGELSEICPDPAIYLLSRDLAPGERLILQRGPAQVTILARSRPTLELAGQVFRGIGGNEFFATTGLRLRGRIPAELLIVEGSAKLVVTVSAQGLAAPVELIIEPNTEGAFELDLEQTCRDWKPGLSRLRIELRRADLRRAMARLATWLWSGLARIEDRARFHCLALPANLSPDPSDNLSQDEALGIISYRSDTNRFFRLRFRTDSGRDVQFKAAVPGVFMMLKRFRENQVDELPLQKGQILALRNDSREVLEVYSSQGGILSLGSLRPEIPARSGLLRLHLSTLAEQLEPGMSQLCIELPSGVLEPLLQLVTSHRVLWMKRREEGGIFSLQLDLATLAESLRCTARDMLSGKVLTFDIACNDSAARLNRETLVWLSCGERQANGQFQHTLEFPLERWCTGAWLLQVEARLNRRWGSLVNESEEVYVWGFLLDETGALTSRHWLTQRVKRLDERASIKVFKRVHQALLPCYAPDAWTGISLADAWQRLANDFHPRDGQLLTELLALDALVPPQIGQPSWFPLLLPGVAMPWIYARDAASYRGLGQRAGLIGELNQIRAPLSALFGEYYLERIVAGAFQNVKQMQQGEPPKGFSMKRYREALSVRNIDDAWAQLKREDWRPTVGDYLGAVHWRYALNSLDSRYQAALADDKLRLQRGWALHLIGVTWTLSINNLTAEFPIHLVDIEGVGLLTEIPRYDWSEEQMNLANITRFLCLFAAVCRWESRRPGVLNCWEQLKYSTSLTSLPDSNACSQAIGYLLYVGRDVFEFYLMLWELAFAADVDAANKELANV